MPAMRTAGVNGSHHAVPKEVDGDPLIKDTGEGHDIYAALKAADERGMRPVKTVDVDTTAVERPAQVDADLEGKSAYVQRAVMERRAELKRVQDLRAAELAAAQAEAEAREAAKDAAKSAHEGRLREWATEATGARRNLRVLISTLHTILWEGARWEPVPLAKLVIPSKVKVFFMKAVTVVHPDKAATLTDPGAAFIAGQVFHYLEDAWREFQEKELNA